MRARGMIWIARRSLRRSLDASLRIVQAKLEARGAFIGLSRESETSQRDQKALRSDRIGQSPQAPVPHFAPKPAVTHRCNSNPGHCNSGRIGAKGAIHSARLSIHSSAERIHGTGSTSNRPSVTAS